MTAACAGDVGAYDTMTITTMIMVIDGGDDDDAVVIDSVFIVAVASARADGGDR